MDVAPLMMQIDHLLGLARRVSAVNRAFGTSLTPEQVSATYPDETIDLLLAWQQKHPE